VPGSGLVAEYEEDDDLYDDFGDFGSLTPSEAQKQSSGEPSSAQPAQPSTAPGERRARQWRVLRQRGHHLWYRPLPLWSIPSLEPSARSRSTR